MHPRQPDSKENSGRITRTNLWYLTNIPTRRPAVAEIPDHTALEIVIG